jgi:hypothetical protein
MVAYFAGCIAQGHLFKNGQQLDHLAEGKCAAGLLVNFGVMVARLRRVDNQLVNKLLHDFVRHGIAGLAVCPPGRVFIVAAGGEKPEACGL